jgi:hypothetical protein
MKKNGRGRSLRGAACLLWGGVSNGPASRQWRGAKRVKLLSFENTIPTIKDGIQDASVVRAMTTNTLPLHRLCDAPPKQVARTPIATTKKHNPDNFRSTRNPTTMDNRRIPPHQTRNDLLSAVRGKVRNARWMHSAHALQVHFELKPPMTHAAFTFRTVVTRKRHFRSLPVTCSRNQRTPPIPLFGDHRPPATGRRPAWVGSFV